MPIGRRPFLDFLLSALADAGVTDVCLVVAPDHAPLRERYGPGGVARRTTVSFAVQERPLGTADAVLAVEAFAAGEELLVLNGDDLYPAEALLALRELPGPGTVLFSPSALSSFGRPGDARATAFAAGIVGPEGFLSDLVEKPGAGLLASLGDGLLVSMNCWRLPPAIFEACRRVTPSPRGELELPDAVRIGIRELGLRFRVVRSDRPVLDLSTRSDVAAVAAALAGWEPRP